MNRIDKRWNLGLAFIVAALCAGSAAGEPAEIIAALLHEPPDDLAALEKAVGPIGRDRSKWEEAVGPITRTRSTGPIAKVRVELAVDFYHFDPQTVENPQLGSYRLDFREGRSAVRGLLEKLAGPPRELADGGQPVLRFKDFYYYQYHYQNSSGQEPGAADGFSLAWYRTEPDFAVPRRTEQETVRLVTGLTVLLRDGISRAAIEERFGKLTPKPDWGRDEVKGADWELHVSPSGGPAVEEVVFVTRRPIPGQGIVRALGLKEPGVIRTGPHVLESLVVDAQGAWLPIVHGYAVEVELDRAAPLVKTGRKRGAEALYQSRDYPIESLSIRRQRQ